MNIRRWKRSFERSSRQACQAFSCFLRRSRVTVSLSTSMCSRHHMRSFEAFSARARHSRILVVEHTTFFHCFQRLVSVQVVERFLQVDLCYKEWDAPLSRFYCCHQDAECSVADGCLSRMLSFTNAVCKDPNKPFPLSHKFPHCCQSCGSPELVHLLCSCFCGENKTNLELLILMYLRVWNCLDHRERQPSEPMLLLRACSEVCVPQNQHMHM